jgi:hypothetical protein
VGYNKPVGVDTTTAAETRRTGTVETYTVTRPVCSKSPDTICAETDYSTGMAATHMETGYVTRPVCSKSPDTICAETDYSTGMAATHMETGYVTSTVPETSTGNNSSSKDIQPTAGDYGVAGKYT